MVWFLLLLTAADWPQFGGPSRDFRAAGPVSAWPSSGPRQLWSRPLGEGYSGIAVEGGALYTMYRRGNQEVVLAAAASTGKTLWEHAYDAPSRPHQDLSFGPGPHSTPLVAGGRVFTTGINAHLYAHDLKTGKVLWFKDLEKDFPGATRMDRGYSSSPLAYKDWLILQIGGPNHAVIALRQADGKLVWAGGSWTNSPGSPQIVPVAGRNHLITTMSGEVIGMDPDTGSVLWSHPHSTDYGLNVAMPVAGSDGIVVVSSAYSGGARGLQLTAGGGKTQVRELWSNKYLRVHHGTLLRIGDLVFGSSGDFGPAPVTAVDVRTGKVAWRDRAFPKATFVQAGDKVVLLDEDGDLAIVTFGPDGMKVLAKAPLLTNNAWTSPSLAGGIAYLRDRKTMMAVDLRP